MPIDFEKLGKAINAEEFDSVYRIEGDQVVDVPALYAPSVYADSDGDYIESDDWEFVTTGCSGQDRYTGPVMHASEFIGAGLARHLVERAEDYTAFATVVVEWIEEDDDSDSPAGWAIIGLRERS